jgi:RNA recognition motif-containing protein
MVFLQYRTPAQACAGKDALNGAEIANRKVRIGWAQKNTTLFVGDLDGTVNTELLRDIFGEYGELVEDETFVKPGVGKFGFVRFKNRADAEKAKIGMSRKVIGTRSIRIGWGDNNVQKHCVHVQFNPTGADNLSEERLHSAFHAFGPVDSVSLPRHSNTGRLKGYCFIHFEDSEEGEKAAAKAISDMSAGVIDDVVVRSSYAKRHGFNKRNRNKSPTAGGQPTPPMFSPMAVPNMPNGMYNGKSMNFSRPNDDGRFQNGMMPMPNPYFVPAVNPLGFVQAVAMQNMQQGYMNQFQKFNGHPASFQFQNSNGQGFQGVPEFPNQMRGQMLPPRHQQGSPQMYQDRSFPDPGFEAYSPHLGPAHMMSPQLYGSPVLSQVPPLHMAPSMGSYLPPNGYYNTHAH